MVNVKVAYRSPRDHELLITFDDGAYVQIYNGVVRMPSPIDHDTWKEVLKLPNRSAVSEEFAYLNNQYRIHLETRNNVLYVVQEVRLHDTVWADDDAPYILCITPKEASACLGYCRRLFGGNLNDVFHKPTTYKFAKG